MKPLRVVSLYAGCGTLDLGFERAGFETVAAYEFWEPAVAVWNANRKNKVCVMADIRELRLEDLPPHDMVIGGPPCQPFSQARKGLEKWLRLPKATRAKLAATGGIHDPRNGVPDFFRLAAGGPYLMENVEQGLPELHGIGNYFSTRLTALDYGDVTIRRRWFYSDLPFVIEKCPGRRRFRHPDPALDICDRAIDGNDAAYYRNVLGDSTRWARMVGDVGFFGTLTTTSNHIRNHMAQRNLIEHPTAPRPNRPINCLIRPPSIREMQRAHSIPDDWDWCGYGDNTISKMIGNGVPVGMATAVARGVLEAYRQRA